MNSKLSVILLLAFLSACAVTGPADDGYDNSNEWVDNGRLLSNETKTIYKTDESQNTNTATVSSNSSNASAEQDYNTYQQWQKAKEDNSSEYQKFKKWQEFEEFQRWKKQQSE